MNQRSRHTKVQGEWSFICTGHNLLKLFRFGGWADGDGRQPRIPSAGFLPEQHPIGIAP